MKGEKTLASGNVAHWSILQGLGDTSAIEVRLARPASDADDVEVRAFMEEMRPSDVTLLARGSADAAHVHSIKAAVDSFLGRSSN